MKKSTDKRIALVIGSGAVMCAASIGLWKTLQREGIGICRSVGCSAGSMYAAMVALGTPPAEAEIMTLDLWKADVYEGYATNLRAALSGETRFTERSGLIDDRLLLERLRAAFGERTFADTCTPLHLVTTDLYTGESVVLSNGLLRDAIRASMSIPMIFSPWQIGDRLLVDGAVSDPLPVDVAIKEGADIILAMGFELPARAHLRSYTAVTGHFNNLYINNILKASFAFHNLAHHAEVIPVLPRFDRPVGTFDTQLIPYVIEQGERAAQEQMPYLRRLVEAG